MKREFLKSLKLADAEIDAIMAEAGKACSGLHQSVSALSAERDELRAELARAQQALQEHQAKTADAEVWQNQCKALEEQLSAAQYGFSVQRAADAMHFSSKSAKNAFISELTAKKLPLQDGTLEGLDAFIGQYRQNDPNAFVQQDAKQPVVVRGGSGNPIHTDDGLRAAFGL